MKRATILLTTTLLTLSSLFQLQAQNLEQFAPAADSVNKYISQFASMNARISIETVSVKPKNTLEITFNLFLSYYPIRDNNVKDIYNIVRELLPPQYSKYDLKLFCNKSPLEDLSSPYYSSRKVKSTKKGKTEKVITNNSKPYEISNGLQSNHIALWQSHGYYYNQQQLRWQWQRATIFQTVEDLYTQSYVVPFLVPMLENAGANVFMPRERDVQLHEVIVDGDNPNELGYREKDGKIKWSDSPVPGFANPKPFYETGENPFVMGKARIAGQISVSTSKESSKSSEISEVKWVPAIPESGEYAVYVSYQTLPNSTNSAQYIVDHKGGSTRFTVNQRMGGGTWIYLGTFAFEEGAKDQGVRLLNSTPDKVAKDAVVVADGVKFGGGMGNIARKPNTEMIDNVKSSDRRRPVPAYLTLDVEPEISHYPRFTEGSRYWLQWAGFADSVYTINKNRNDYNDDYMSRGLWVNAMSGGSRVNPQKQGLNIPLDLSLAFHTDAGTTLNDSIIGTLAIYTRFSNDVDVYPSGEPRIISREYTDIVQTQIVDDIRALFEPEWERRGLWDRSYHESRSPEVPGMLLELLSHQNFADLRYGLDPKFRFHVSRSIYKGMLKFLSQRYGFEYVVQPLPPVSFAAGLGRDKAGQMVADLSWKGVSDPLEPTAEPVEYILYTRTYDPIEGNEFAGFDNGQIVKGTSTSVSVKPGLVYSFKVAALNKGGESFPTEILSVGTTNGNSKGTVLIVNGFDRISAPASYATKDSTRAGFDDELDSGVPYIRDISHIGSQYERRRVIPWMDDNSPGFGASHRDYETKVIAGNTFDYPFSHGISILKLGYNFVSSSRDALTEGRVDINSFPVVDFIMGKQVKTKMGKDSNANIEYEVFPVTLQNIIRDYTSNGGNIIVSGSYIATDLWDKIYNEKPKERQSKNIREISQNTRQFSREINSIQTELYKESNKFAGDTNSVNGISDRLKISAKLLDSLRYTLNTIIRDVEKFEQSIDPEEQSRQFAINVLKYRWMTHYASSTCEVKAAQSPYDFKGKYHFNNTFNDKIYSVDSPDGLVPVGENAWTIFRYGDNNISAGVAYKGDDYKSVSLGFPIETLKTRKQIDNIFMEIFSFFEK